MKGDGSAVDPGVCCLTLPLALLLLLLLKLLAPALCECMLCFWRFAGGSDAA
jgi:hypothetical protein